MKKPALWISAVTLTGLLAGCGHATTPPMNNTVAAAPTNMVSNSTNETSPAITEPAKKPAKKPVKKPVSKPKTTTTTTHSTTTTKTTSAPKPTTSSQPSNSTTTSNTTSNTTSSTGNSTSGGSSTPAPSSVVTQYVHLAFTGNPPSSLTTVKMEYNKSTGVMEAFPTGLSSSSYWFWVINTYAGTLTYSNNGGSSWLTAQKGVQYSSMQIMQGVSYTPSLVLKANTTSMAFGLGNYSGKNGGSVPQGTFQVTYSNGTFSVTPIS